MKVHICALFDENGKVFHRPFSVESEAQAIREFKSVVNEQNPNNILNQYPEEFSLYKLGEFEQENGECKLVPTEQKVLSRGSELVDK